MPRNVYATKLRSKVCTLRGRASDQLLLHIITSQFLSRKIHEFQRAEENKVKRERDSQLYYRPFSTSVSRRRGYEKVNTPVGTGGRGRERERKRKRDRDGKFAR